MNTEKDERKAQCPYCKNGLKKVPSAKTKCPVCKEFMYVRTRIDGVRAVVTKLQLEEIEKEWQNFGPSVDWFKYIDIDQSSLKFQKAKKELVERFNGKEPSSSDVLWKIFNEQFIQYSAEKEWGLYRNTIFHIGCLFLSEGKDFQGLRTFLEVCYLDVNMQSLDAAKYVPLIEATIEKGLLKESKEQFFDGHSTLAPVIINAIKRIRKDLNLSIDEVMHIHNEHLIKVKDTLNIPMTLEVSWDLIKQEIDGDT
jgi:hypothetical protein